MQSESAKPRGLAEVVNCFRRGFAVLGDGKIILVGANHVSSIDAVTFLCHRRKISR
jgi:1-acyl-sn-glycerol-3-phosphate acyltransferase